MRILHCLSEALRAFTVVILLGMVVTLLCWLLGPAWRWFAKTCNSYWNWCAGCNNSGLATFLALAPLFALAVGLVTFLACLLGFK